jgi:hypothetical protein
LFDWGANPLLRRRKTTMDIWKHVIRQTAKEYSAKTRLVVIGFAGLVFVAAIPAGLFWISIRYG